MAAPIVAMHLLVMALSSRRPFPISRRLPPMSASLWPKTAQAEINLLARATDANHRDQLKLVAVDQGDMPGEIQFTSDGRFIVDTDQGFEDLAEGETASYELRYTVADEQGLTDEGVLTDCRHRPQ